MKKFLKFLKENCIFLIIYIVVFVALIIKFPYYIDAPGGLINVDKRITIEGGGYSSKGSLNLAYVSEYEATLPMLFLSLFHDDWNVYPKKSGEVPDSYEDILARDRLWMRASYANAAILAYEKAGKEIKITDRELFVLYIYEEAKTDLKVGDELVSIEGVEIHSREDLSKEIEKKEVGDKVTLEVFHSGESYTRTAEIIEVEDTKIIGFILTEIRNYEADPAIKISYSDTESGPSGGLMVSLAIYNALVEEDITGGKVIVGTGTIESDGSVGEIGGVEYKLKGAASKKADIFFVPAGENYEEAIALKEKKNYSITIVPISTFDEALEYLKKNVE